ncbi:hypothetical protein GE09DRAFT_1212900 [Coniochaeta sp. 2T2.1]|nr:hypothetical protein GE09DRAFT_1212900 [Coniochaeta sp. 2T2.1]
MNNDPLPSSAAGGQPSTASTTNESNATEPEAVSAAESERLRKAGLAKKLQFMTHLMKSLDMVVFAEICTLYYMECSFPRLLLRVIPHYFFLTPKSEDYALLMPAHRPHAFAVFVPNLLCMLFHLMFRLPQAGEATRGYLHGGVIIDFVGQKAPTSKLGLLVLDVVVLAVQCLMLAVHQEREGLRKLVSPGRAAAALAAATGAAPVATAAGAPTTAQDHDAEERGVIRTAGETDEIELRPVSGNDTGSGGGEDATPETTRLLPGSSLRQASDGDLLGFLRSGNAVLADFHVVHTVRSVGNDYEQAAAHVTQTIGYTATLAARAAERRARLEAQTRRQP